MRNLIILMVMTLFAIISCGKDSGSKSETSNIVIKGIIPPTAAKKTPG